MLDIKQNISLKNLNTFHIDQSAKYFVQIDNVSDMYQILDSEIYHQNKHFILWWGANTLFKSDFDGLVIKINIQSKEIIAETDDEIIIKVWAWEDRHEFVLRCVAHNYGWIENLVYIPWTVWACPIQNIWAYGAEISQSIQQVFWIDSESRIESILDNIQCKFSYRNSIFKNELKDKFIITHVNFRLKKVKSNYKLNLNYKDVLQKIQDLNLKAEDLSIQELANIIMEIRQSKLPDWKQIWTAWSFFQNPIISKEKYLLLKEIHPDLVWFEMDNNIKLSAGQLIEICGFKWYRDGDVGVYINHALVLVNYANANWEDIINLAENIQNKILEKFNLIISPEVNYI